MKTPKPLAATAAVPRRLDDSMPERITLHIYNIERAGMPRIIAVTQREYDVKRILAGDVVIERANGTRIYIAVDTVTRVDYSTREVPLDALH